MPHYDMPYGGGGHMPGGPPMHGNWNGPGPGDMHHPQQHPYGNPMAHRGYVTCCLQGGAIFNYSRFMVFVAVIS